MKVVIWRIENSLRGKVDFSNSAKTILFTNDGDIMALAIDGQVSNHTEGFKNCQALTCYNQLARANYISQYTNFEVHQFNRHDGIDNMSLINQFTLNH